MKKEEIEKWAREVIERTKRGYVDETSFEECKLEFPDSGKKYFDWAKQIGGMANASNGEQFIFIVGVNYDKQKQQFITRSVEHINFAEFKDRLTKHFDERKAPEIADSKSFEFDNTTMMAIVFNSSKVPYVLKNQNSPNAFPEYIVPWSEGTGSRAANRSNLLDILQPKPSIGIEGCEIVRINDFGAANTVVKTSLELVIDILFKPINLETIIIRKNDISFEFYVLNQIFSFDPVSIKAILGKDSVQIVNDVVNIEKSSILRIIARPRSPFYENEDSPNPYSNVDPSLLKVNFELNDSDYPIELERNLVFEGETNIKDGLLSKIRWYFGDYYRTHRVSKLGLKEFKPEGRGKRYFP